MFTVQQGTQQSVASGSSQSIIVTFTGGTVVSAGFQNLGMAVEIWASQIIVQSATNVFYQVINGSLTHTDWIPWAVVYTPGSGDPPASAFQPWTASSSTGWGSQTVYAPSGTLLVSLGVWNDAEQTAEMTQIFPQSTSQWFVQYVGASSTVTWAPVGVTYTPPSGGGSLTFVVVSGSQYSCPGWSSQTIEWSGGNATLVAIGFQNIGMAVDCYASQMFIYSATGGVTQFYNNSITSTDWVPWALYVADSAASAVQDAPVATLRETRALPGRE